MIVANIFDWVLIGFIAACVFQGLMRGVFSDLWALLGWILAGFVGMVAYELLSAGLIDVIARYPLLGGLERYLAVVALIPTVVVALIVMVFTQLVGRRAAMLLGSVLPLLLDGGLGAISGLVRGAMIVLLLYAVIAGVLFSGSQFGAKPDWLTQSVAVTYIEPLSRQMTISAYGMMDQFRKGL